MTVSEIRALAKQEPLSHSTPTVAERDSLRAQRVYLLEHIDDLESELAQREDELDRALAEDTIRGTYE